LLASFNTKKWFNLFEFSCAEVVDQLYSTFTFDLIDLETSLQFFSTVPRVHLQRITAIQMTGMLIYEAYHYHRSLLLGESEFKTVQSDWSRLCAILGGIGSLKKLNITIPCSYLGDNVEGGITSQIRSIRQVPKSAFIIIVVMRNKTDCGLGGLDLDNAPFNVQSSPEWDFLQWRPSTDPDPAHYPVGRTRRRRAILKHVLLSPVYIIYICVSLAADGYRDLREHIRQMK
jgi:hypothetical protein